MLLSFAPNPFIYPLADTIMATLAESVPEMVLIVFMMIQVMRFTNNVIAMIDGNRDSVMNLLVEMSAMCSKMQRIIDEQADLIEKLKGDTKLPPN